MVVDHERAWQRLKETVAGRQGIGIGSLLQLMGEIETECAVEEGLPERALRLYGMALSHDLITSGTRPAPPKAQAPTADGEGAALPRANGSKEEKHGADSSPGVPAAV